MTDMRILAVVGLIVAGYLFLGWLLVVMIDREVRRWNNPQQAAEWAQVRLPMWQMVVGWPPIYGALILATIRQYRKRHSH